MSSFTINGLTEPEARALRDEIIHLDDKLDDKIYKVMSATMCNYVDALEYVVADSPVLWAKVYLNWEARDYQDPILKEGKKSKQLVLRLGRRLGKTDSMCVLILWYAYTQINRGENGQYNILILTPYETQIDLIFTRLGQLIDGSELLKSMLSRDIYHRKELKNGTIILGLTAGASSGNNGSNNTRGQRADLIILDEVDYIGSSQITNIMNIRNEAPERIRMIVASTPCGKHEEFYKWCTESSKSYKPDPKDIKNFEFNGYIVTNSIDTRKEKGNGWTEIYAPSIVNKELLKINPVTEQTYLQDIKDELSELRYDQEVMAEFGDEELGVYQKKYLQQAVQNGIDAGHKYVNKLPANEFADFIANRGNNIRLLGVDWDKVQAGTTMVGLELDKYFKNQDGIMEPKFKVIFRIEIPRSQFTYVNAINKIVELNDVYDFDWIAIDRGYGETQLELLHKYGIENPESGLADKVVGYQFGEKINVRDPYTHKVDKKPLKPFMVNNSVVMFEKNKMIFDPSDKLLLEQFEGYRIKAISTTGVPTYTDENEHIVDAVNLCLLIFQQKYGDLFKNIISSKILAINEIIRHGENVDSRDMELKKIRKPTESLILGIGLNNSDRGFVSNNRAGLIGTGAHSSFRASDSRFSRGRF